MRRNEPPDFLLFALISLAALVPLSFVDLTGNGHTLAGHVRHIVRGDPGWLHDVSGAAFSVAMFALPAAGLGWWLQGVAVRRGLRLSGRPEAPQRGDYDDAPAAGPPAPPLDPDRPVTVFVALPNEGTDVWRPVVAYPVGPMLFRLTGPVPEGEAWAFEPGAIVRCWERTFACGTRGLAAVELADP